MATKSIGSGNLSFIYETDEQKAQLQQIAAKLMAGGQIDYLVGQKRLSEANQALTEVDSIAAALTRDAGYRTCCEPTNNGRLNPARNAAASKIRAAEQQAAQEQRNQAFTQGLQTMVSEGAASLAAMRDRNAAYQPLQWQPATSGGSNLPLILGLVGGGAVLLLLVILLTRR